MTGVLKNPIVMAIIVGVLVYFLYSYYIKYTDADQEPDKTGKPNKSNKNSKNKGDKSDKTKSSEMPIILAGVASVVTWFLYYYFGSGQDKTQELNLTNSIEQMNHNTIMSGTDSIDGIIDGANLNRRTGVNTKSYNLIGGGVDMINNVDLKIPNVLLDYK